MEWSAPGIVLAARTYGEGDALAVVFTAEHGVYRGLARGGSSRAKSPTWQSGNLIEARWVARLSEQLGSLTAELVHAASARAMDDALSLAVLSASCAVAEQALVERQPQPRLFQGLLHLIAHLGPLPGTDAGASVAELVLWELELLAELGYGLDLASCTLTGRPIAGVPAHAEAPEPAFVSPRTGRAVSGNAAGAWVDKLLPLPAFIIEAGTNTNTNTNTNPDAPGRSAPTYTDLAAGLRLTGHFLERDAFGTQHKPMPQARTLLQDRINRIV